MRIPTEREIVNKKAIARDLLEWFEKEGISYPFRATSDPYKILVCEMLLRKTTAKQVAKLYDSFFSKFPTVESLSKASVEEIVVVIKPLGILSRAYDLLQAARMIVWRYGGKVPYDGSLLISLKGVGRYIANCVLAFGYGKTVPLVDSNVNRVLSRILDLRTDRRGEPKRELWQAYSELTPNKNRREFHYALIDLAHKVCTARDPSCGRCPIHEHCKYTAHRTSFPI